jgi:hypothetical protein
MREQKRQLVLVVEEVDCEEKPRSHHLARMSSPNCTWWKATHHPLTLQYLIQKRLSCQTSRVWTTDQLEEKANKIEEGDQDMRDRKGYTEEEIQNHPQITPSTRKQKNHRG